jgi:hypothetical protein
VDLIVIPGLKLLEEPKEGHSSRPSSQPPVKRLKVFNAKRSLS